MLEMPLVTICIPSYNHSAYVLEAINSVRLQTYPQIELIVIDDGSTDASASLIEPLQSELNEEFVRFEFRSRENLGLAKTLNEALNWSRGKYFAMLSSDDILYPDKTTILVGHIEKHSELGGVFAGYDQIDSAGIVARRLIPKPGIWNFSDVLAKRCQLYAPTMLLRTEAMRRVGGYWEEIALEDRGMVLKLSNAGYLLATIAEPVAYYRWHATNTIKNTERMTEARLQILSQFEQTEDISAARAKVLFGAALELAKKDKERAKYYFNKARISHTKSILTRSAFRAARKIWLS